MPHRPSERQVIAFLAFLSISLAFGIDVSLPAFDEIRDSFDLADGAADVGLTVTSYFMGMAVGQVVYGPFADRFGRLPILFVGLGVYAVGAIASGLAVGLATLLAARFVWGVGAAAPAVLRSAVARDLYGGDQMARVLALTMAVFLVGPMLAPAFGEVILLVGSWRVVYLCGAVVAAVAALWGLRFGETLAPENRRPLQFDTTLTAFRMVLRTRASIGYIVAMTFSSGAFFTFLGSAQPIIDQIYGRGDWFALIFAGSSVLIAIVLFGSSRYMERFGAAPVVRVSAVGITTLGAVFVAASLGFGGDPGFWVWLTLVSLLNCFATMLSPAGNALAMTPMARIAGTASAVLGLMTMAGGAILATLFTRLIDDTVTPMAVAYLGYGLAATVAVRWAEGGSLDPVDPDAVVESRL